MVTTYINNLLFFIVEIDTSFIHGFNDNKSFPITSTSTSAAKMSGLKVKLYKENRLYLNCLPFQILRWRLVESFRLLLFTTFLLTVLVTGRPKSEPKSAVDNRLFIHNLYIFSILLFQHILGVKYF